MVSGAAHFGPASCDNRPGPPIRGGIVTGKAIRATLLRSLCAQDFCANRHHRKTRGAAESVLQLLYRRRMMVRKGSMTSRSCTLEAHTSCTGQVHRVLQVCSTHTKDGFRVLCSLLNVTLQLNTALRSSDFARAPLPRLHSYLIAWHRCRPLPNKLHDDHLSCWCQPFGVYLPTMRRVRAGMFANAATTCGRSKDSNSSMQKRLISNRRSKRFT